MEGRRRGRVPDDRAVRSLPRRRRSSRTPPPSSHSISDLSEVVLLRHLASEARRGPPPSRRGRRGGAANRSPARLSFRTHSPCAHRRIGTPPDSQAPQTDRTPPHPDEYGRDRIRRVTGTFVTGAAIRARRGNPDASFDQLCRRYESDAQVRVPKTVFNASPPARGSRPLADRFVGNEAFRETNRAGTAVRQLANPQFSARRRCHHRREATGRRRPAAPPPRRRRRRHHDVVRQPAAAASVVVVVAARGHSSAGAFL